LVDQSLQCKPPNTITVLQHIFLHHPSYNNNIYKLYRNLLQCEAIGNYIIGSHKRLITLSGFYNNCKYFKKLLSFRKLSMRFGINDLEKFPNFEGVERAVLEVLIHPKFESPKIYYDVAIAVAGKQECNVIRIS
jgi:hypothetical protein